MDRKRVAVFSTKEYNSIQVETLVNSKIDKLAKQGVPACSINVRPGGNFVLVIWTEREEEKIGNEF